MGGIKKLFGYAKNMIKQDSGQLYKTRLDWYTYNMKKTSVSILSIILLLNAQSAYASNKPINSKENKNSCTYVKTKYQSSVMSDWSNGLKTDQDVIKEIELNIKMLSKRAAYTNGKIQVQVKSWLNAEKRTKMSLINGDIDGISAAMTLKISSINNLNKLCKSIGK
jgi:osmotically-inducible protein OsmY